MPDWTRRTHGTRLALTLTVMLAAAAAVALAEEWKTYNYPPDGFSAVFPTEPSLGKRNIDTDNGTFLINGTERVVVSVVSSDDGRSETLVVVISPSSPKGTIAVARSADSKVIETICGPGPDAMRVEARAVVSRPPLLHVSDGKPHVRQVAVQIGYHVGRAPGRVGGLQGSPARRLPNHLARCRSRRQSDHFPA